MMIENILIFRFETSEAEQDDETMFFYNHREIL